MNKILLLITALMSNILMGATNDIVLVVNGLSLSSSDYLARCEMMVELFKNKNPTAKPEQINQVRLKTRQTLHRSILQRMIIKTKLSSSNLTQKAEVQKSIERQYLKSFGAKKQTFQQLRAKMVKLGYGRQFWEDFQFDVRLQNVFEQQYSNRLTVTEEELSGYKKDVADFNARASATNELNRAFGRKLIERYKKGESFAKLADEYSADDEKQPGGSLGECIEGDFSGEDIVVWQAVRDLPEGGVTDVLQVEDGYAIYHVDKHLSAGESSSGEVSVELSRIFIRRAFMFADQTDEEFEADVIQEKREAFLKEFLMDLARQSKVAYPQGRLYFSKIKN